jgi:hypothetical protein
MFASGSHFRKVPVALALLLPSLCPLLSADQELLRAAAESNVNQRYTIENVTISGVRFDEAKIPAHLRRRIVAMLGTHCDLAALEDLASDLRRELHLREVSRHLLKGSRPDLVRVDFEVVRKTVEISVPRFLLHSRQKATGEVDANVHAADTTFMAGIVSNGDNLVERFTGIVARFEDERLGTDKIRFGVGFEDYHELWNPETRDAILPASGLMLYRARTNIAPEFTFLLARPLSVSLGLSFERLDPEDRTGATREANALTADLVYGRKIEGDGSQQSFGARYSIRAATRSLGSSYSYTRHMVAFRYEIRSGRQTASDELTGGALAGQAPLFERFVLGSDSTLRGWDRYAIDPIGGDRMVHNSMTYGYQFGERTAEAFYDCGALWNSGRAAQLRHSVGIGYRQGIFVLTMAFPVEGRIAPVFMAGMNY